MHQHVVNAERLGHLRASMQQAVGSRSQILLPNLFPPPGCRHSLGRGVTWPAIFDQPTFSGSLVWFGDCSVLPLKVSLCNLFPVSQGTNPTQVLATNARAFVRGSKVELITAWRFSVALFEEESGLNLRHSSVIASCGFCSP